MKGCGQILLDSQFLTECFSEVGRETGVSAANYFCGESEPSVYVVHIQLCVVEHGRKIVALKHP